MFYNCFTLANLQTELVLKLIIPYVALHVRCKIYRIRILTWCNNNALGGSSNSCGFRWYFELDL